jgi:hypothetical protein
VEISETIFIEIAGTSAADEACPFAHSNDDTNDNVTNCWDNNPTILAANLGSEWHFASLEEGTTAKGTSIAVQHSAHHLIPGNESWPKTHLMKWMDRKDKKQKSCVNGNIGYDVNGRENGCSLPGSAGATKTVADKSNGIASWSTHPDQEGYAHAAMESTLYHRQFHDRHPTYSAFVVNVLNKISEKLDGPVVDGLSPGCGKKECGCGGGPNRNVPPFNPPFNLLPRLEDVAVRLHNKLVENYRKWKLPIVTSAWALTFRKTIDVHSVKEDIAKQGAALRKRFTQKTGSP